MTAVAEPRPPSAPARSRRRRLLRSIGRIPVAGRWIALLACLNAVAWGLIVPPFHVPDEPSHFYYAQYLAETGELPKSTPAYDVYSDDINLALGAQAFGSVIGHRGDPVPSLESDTDAFRVLQDRPADRAGSGDAATASNNPPLYYLPYAAAYYGVQGTDVTGRLAVMRLISALLAGLTTLCVYLFLREVIPGRPLAWAVGAIAAGLQPTFAFISSGVNNDAGLFLVSSALLLALARVLHRGLTVRRALAVGLLLGLGVLVKTQALAFAPAVGLALLIAAWRGRRGRPWGALAAAVGAGAAPLFVYAVLGSTIWDRPVFDRVAEVAPGAAAAGKPWIFAEQLSYLWQLYLPRTPNLTDLLEGFAPYDLWFKGLIGRFGWIDYGVDEWVYPFARAIFIVVAVLAIVALWQRRAVVRARLGELAVYGMFAAGLCVAIAIAGYRAYVDGATAFEQARYLLPLLGLYALFPAVALLALPRRWRPVLAVLLVSGVLVHGALAALATLERYYG